MTSQLLELRSSSHRGRSEADIHLDDLPQPVSSVLAAYRQQTSSTPYWPPTSSLSGDVIMTSYGIGGAGYVVHSGPSGLVSPWPTQPPIANVDRLSELGASGGCTGRYGSYAIAAVPPLSTYAGGVDLKPWTTNNYVPSPPTAVSPHFHSLPQLTSTRTALFYSET